MTDRPPVARRRRYEGERGLAVVMTSLVLVPLMIFAAFGVDLASWYSRVSTLQRAADAAALAGAVWMPDFTRAQNEAIASLNSNHLYEGVNGIHFDFARGAKPTALRVTVTDTNAKRWFSQVFQRTPQVLSRFAEAEYNLPLPLGSPLNYFGGDSTKTAIADTYTLTWPIDYASRQPANYGCNVGTSAAQNFGRWNGSGNYGASGFSGSTQCYWTSANSGQLPPNYTTRAPSTLTSNGSCNVLPGTGRQAGTWTRSGTTTTFNGSANNGNSFPTCGWVAAITTNTFANPIDPTRSPGFWAAIEGPQTQAWNGDAFNTRCWTSANCTAAQNAMYRDSSDPNRGFWYAIKIPAGLANATIRINVYDGAYTADSPNCGGSSQPSCANYQAGDRSLGSDTTAFPTQFQVYQQTNPLDFNARAPKFSGSPNQTPGSCNLAITNTSAFVEAWQNICTISNVNVDDIYLLNVQTTGTAGDGVNGYALEVAANGSASAQPQPALYALTNMGMQNNNSCTGSGCTPPPATFYLAQVGPQFAGRTLVMELWDPGDVSGGVTARMRPMMPSTNTSTPRPVVNVPASGCTYTADSSPNSSISGTTGGVIATAHASDDSTVCEVQSSTSSGQRFGGEWVRIRIPIPPTYDCDLVRPRPNGPPVNPETQGNSCWWGIQYIFSGAANDVTTWQARIEGNPLQLVG